MSELAFNINGEPFEVPAAASGWRVRRLKAKGAPEVVYGRDGLPLVLPIDADLDDLKAETGTAGRYRLDPIDETHKPIANAAAGYVFVHANARPAESTVTSLAAPSDNVAIEAMRMNAEMARSIIDRFPQMMEAAATLLRAADGAGLPARAPRANDQDDDGAGDELDARPGFDLNALVAQLVPMLMMSLGSGKVKLPGLGEMLDWRKAAASTHVTKDRQAKAALGPDPALASGEPTTETGSLPPIDAATMAHFAAVQAMLTAEESGLAREIASELTPAELRAWFDELSKLGVAEAAQKVRKMISGASKTGGAS